jgi:hypothetical protein
MIIYVPWDSIIEKKLTWEQIEEQYDQEWVELIDYDWPEGMPYPQAGTVRVHASDCKTFYSLANKEPRPTRFSDSLRWKGSTSSTHNSLLFFDADRICRFRHGLVSEQGQPQ